MQAADRAIVGARIRTLDPDRPFATAVAMRDGVIIGVGDDASVRALGDARTDWIDGDGLSIVPGLTDSHIHPFWGAEATQGLDLFDIWTLDDLRSALAAEWERNPEAPWIRGWGVQYTPFLQSGIRGDLFADAVGDTPTYLRFFDGHTAVANDLALRAAGITGARDFPEAAAIVCDSAGRPTGELQESGAFRLVEATIPEPTDAERYQMYVASIRDMNAHGLTSLHVMDGTPATYDLLRELEANGDLTIRMIVPLHQQPEMSFGYMREQLPLCGVRGRRWRGGAAKFFIDGVIDSGTAWLVEPDTHGESTLPFWPDPERYKSAVALFAGSGFQCITHAVGDMAVRCALDAYQAAGAAEGVRHRIEHIELLTDEDLPRFAEMGVVASMQPLHMNPYADDRSDQWNQRAGPDNRERNMRTGDLLRSGVTLALGSDWMVAPYDPRIGMAWAQLRRQPGQPDRSVFQPDQALTPLQVLAGYTTEAARTVSEEALSGQIKPGFRADLTAFGADPVETPADDLLDLPILLTVVDGEVVFRQEA